jgi:signal transduction histidine kinase
LIQGTVERLEKEDTFPGRQHAYHLIDRQTYRLLELINQLLDLSKLEAGKLSLHPETGKLSEFLTVLTASFASLFESKRISYQYQLLKEPLYVIYDQDKLEKILTNLLSNAFKFTPSGGKVFFGVEVTKKDPTHCTLQFTLQDTGIGISEKQLPHIFDRFHQVDSSATRSYEGAGVGLALVKELVALHGGEISVDSKEGTGTTISLLLPF